MSNQEVIWVPIPGYESRYEVSSDGRIRSIARTTKLKAPYGERFFPSVEKKQCLDSNAKSARTVYLQVQLSTGGRGTGRTFKVHHLVALAFIGPRPEGMEIRHIDGDSKNNAASNLCYGTHKENMDDRAVHGNHQITGEDHPKAKLTDAQVIEIRNCSETGVSLAKRFGVTKQSIYQARRGETWKHLNQAHEVSA